MALDNHFNRGTDTAALVAEIRPKHMQPSDLDWNGTHVRVAAALFPDDYERQKEFHRRMSTGHACPAGRILAGAGSGLGVTWYNCFISPLLQDSMRTDDDKPGKGIMEALANVAYSMQAGGGVGTDFSPLRPKDALVARLMTSASGPLAFMDMWDAMCRTVMSAGHRRGAMMATLRVDHPDVMSFIEAKRTSGRLTMFNVSVLITDEFMRAKDADEEFELGHTAPPFDPSTALAVRTWKNPNTGVEEPWYVYRRVRAREIWDAIMRSTYRYAEPGVIFIDRVNYWNNLGYCEHIQAPNPCGEQMMPPDNSCNLFHVNLSRCVIGTPFTDGCAIDYGAIRDTVNVLVRAADNVIDLSPTPTERQLDQSRAKRRIGLGITGLANMLMFVGQRYGSHNSLLTIADIMETIRDQAYETSIELARDKGTSFPAFDRKAYLSAPFIRTLPDRLREGIYHYGIRNSLLLTIAPTGTVSITQADNASGGVEPVFAARYERKVLQPDGGYKTSIIEDLGFRVYANVLFGGDFDAALAAPLPDYMVTTKDLTPEDHLQVQATAQKFVDNSISKTINCPTEISFEDFASVYDRAYDLGCKSCTTYRPDPTSGRGAVLTEITTVDHHDIQGDRRRPDVLDGRTYRLRWSQLPYPMFITINDEVLPDGKRIPFEVFINSKAVDYAHWVSALTRMISAVMRRGGDLAFLPDELKQVYSARGGEFIDQRYVPSEVALIGYTLERHFREIRYIGERLSDRETGDPEIEPIGGRFAELGPSCPSCGQPTVIRQEGCDKCTSCGWNKCG